MNRNIQLLAILASLTLMVSCGGGGGSDGTVASNTPADFVMEVPIDTTSYFNTDDLNDMASFNPLSPKLAYADKLVQIPPMTNNIIQLWWTDECATNYDEADPSNIRLLPLIGGMKKLVVGEQYHFIIEADRITQHNPCGFGYAVTGEWSFTIASVTVGEIGENVSVVDQFETGELVLQILDNGTDYSEIPIVTVDFTGVDSEGPISGYRPI